MQTHRLATASFFLFCASAAVFAEEPKFQSLAAKHAKLHFENAIERARKDYISALNTALRDATKRGDLDEANVIDAAIKKVDEGAGAAEKLGTRLANSRWRLNGKAGIVSFMQNGTVKTTWGTKGVWKVTTPQTVVATVQTPDKKVFAWQFTVDPNLKFALLLTPELAEASVFELIVDAK